jgi:DNA polymerase
MKRSDYGKYVKQLKEAIEEEKMWGEAEVLLMRWRDKMRAAGKEDAVKGTPRVQPAPASAPAPAPVRASAPVRVPAAAGGGDLEAYRKKIEGCTKCPLGKSRINFVFGVGNPGARLMFVGEGPGYDEDRKGEPFVGRAGQLLTKIIEAMGMRREDVYIANIVKCHPMIDPANPDKRGNDRPPTPEESAACIPYLERQIEIIHPAFICALGNSAARTLLKSDEGISKIRGRVFEYQGIPLMPTYHPAALLRNPALKKDTWNDMKQIMAALKKDDDGAKEQG